MDTSVCGKNDASATTITFPFIPFHAVTGDHSLFSLPKEKQLEATRAFANQTPGPAYYSTRYVLNINLIYVATKLCSGRSPRGAFGGGQLKWLLRQPPYFFPSPPFISSFPLSISLSHTSLLPVIALFFVLSTLTIFCSHYSYIANLSYFYLLLQEVQQTRGRNQPNYEGIWRIVCYITFLFNYFSYNFYEEIIGIVEM